MHICEGCGQEFDQSKDIKSTRFCCEHCRRVYLGRKSSQAKKAVGTLFDQLSKARSCIRKSCDRPNFEQEQTSGNCKFCGKLCKNQNSLRNHERVCKSNPNRQAIENWVKHNENWRNAVRVANKTIRKQFHQTFVCPYCHRVQTTTLSGETTHEKFCPSNPNREVNSRKGTHLSEEVKQYLRSRPGNGGVRKGAGHGKHGWYKGFWCDSSWELAYVIYCLDHDIAIERNHDWFPYVFEGRQRKYYPDFKVGDEYIEIKNYDTPMVIAKIQQFPIDKKLKVLHEGDLTQVFAYVKEKYGENYTELYHL